MLFNLYDLTEKSSVSGYELEMAVDSLNSKNGFYGLGNYFITAERKYNVNAVILTAICCLESAYATSELAKKKNNLFGLGANDSLEGSVYFGEYYATKEECIYSAAHRLGCQYLKRDSKKSWRYLDGKKDIWAVGKKWSSNPQWGDSISDISERLEKEILKFRAKDKKPDYKRLYEDSEKDRILANGKLNKIKEILGEK